MRAYNTGQNFNVVVSTKATLFGALAGDFITTYAPTNDLTNKTVVAGGLSEAIESIATPHEATLSANASYGATMLTVSAGHDIESGDVIEYAIGHFAKVSKATATKLYLRTKTRVSLSSGAELTQVGNTGVYSTPDFALMNEGEYLVTIEAPEYGIIVESRVRATDASESVVVDGDAPIYSEIAVAY